MRRLEPEWYDAGGVVEPIHRATKTQIVSTKIEHDKEEPPGSVKAVVT